MDGDHRAGELVVHQIIERDIAQRLALGRGADDRDGSRPDQRIHQVVHAT